MAKKVYTNQELSKAYFRVATVALSGGKDPIRSFSHYERNVAGAQVNLQRHYKSHGNFKGIPKIGKSISMVLELILTVGEDEASETIARERIKADLEARRKYDKKPGPQKIRMSWGDRY